MREIWFKAKRKDNGKWEEGYYVKKIEWHRIGDEYVKTERHYICVNMVSSEDSYIDRIEVVPETLCQYTGLTDKNGNKIWENDVCQYTETDECGIKMESFVVRYGRKVELFRIEIGFFAEWIKNDYYRCDLGFWAENRNIEVIGNIFDNPELVKGGV